MTNNYEGTSILKEHSLPTEKVEDLSAWTGKDLELRSDYRFKLSLDQQQELLKAIQPLKGKALHEILPEQVSLPLTASLLQHLQSQLREGLGFSLLSGMPIEDLSMKDIELMYWMIGMCVGVGVSQNSDAGLVHYVTDGKLRPNMGERRVGNPGPIGSHVDLSDCVSLLCVRQPPEAPKSTVASAISLYNSILEHHPEWLPLLLEGCQWTRKGEHGSSETNTTGYKVPVFDYCLDKLSIRLNSSWMGKGFLDRGEDIPKVWQDFFDFSASVFAEQRFSYDLNAGDIAFCNNYTVLHGREGHEPVHSEDQKRVLMRLWLDLPRCRPFSDEQLMRYGVIRHGKLGWTAQDLREGCHLQSHSRRSDGVPDHTRTT